MERRLACEADPVGTMGYRVIPGQVEVERPTCRPFQRELSEVAQVLNQADLNSSDFISLRTLFSDVLKNSDLNHNPYLIPLGNRFPYFASPIISMFFY